MQAAFDNEVMHAMYCKVEGRKESKSGKSDSHPKQKTSSSETPAAQQPTVSDRAQELFRSLDTDNDGEITQEEFVNGYLAMHQTVNWNKSMNEMYGRDGGGGGGKKDRNGSLVAAMNSSVNVKQASLRKMFKKSFR